MRTMKINRPFVSLLALSLMAILSCSKKAENELNANTEQNEAVLKKNDTGAQADSSFRVIGYFPDWGDVDQVQFDKLTHIDYAFALPNTDGSIAEIANPTLLRSLVQKAHAQNVKVFISVGGGTAAATNAFNALAAGNASREKFRLALIELISTYALDGADIDWEYPVKGVNDGDYATLIQQLSIALHNEGKQLSTTVTGSYGDFVRTSLYTHLDFVNILAYDEGTTYHSTLDIAKRSLDHWLGLGLPASKAVLAVPFYGLSPTKDALAFSGLLALGADPYSDVFGDYGYNGITTIKAKTDMAFARGNGIAIWNLAHDATGANSLLSAIYTEAQKLKGSAAKK
ncbi:Chitinase, GH18 family [Pedobacter westerhofensis]|uniref:chitinase n=2 Tax=Pedobacter westerhofensis TaxID=425512 RepID=A0A521BLE5_9SPHI|nr:Chitinase, GH18 family [Pedobacter westerhofensis]